MTKYRIEQDAYQPSEGMDWHVELVSFEPPYSAFHHFILIQFGSVGVDKREAHAITDRILKGLNE